MITKIRSIQDSWLVKSILVLTALSFMSLFGVSGYLSSAGKNREIIKVDDFIVYQDDIQNQYQQQLQLAKNLFGDNLEVSDTMKNTMMQDIIKKNLTDAVLKQTANDLHVSISDELVRKIIYSQAEFMDANGHFSIEKLRRLLNASGWTEQKYIETLRADVQKQHLLQNPVENINVPRFMDGYLSQIENQRKVFEYVEVNPQKLAVDRKISQEELEQYYQDFVAQFEEPEKRDLSFIYLPLDKLAEKVVPNEEDIKAYYDENISQYVIPETRNVLQMMFDQQDDADKAMAALNAGSDFYKVAEQFAKQDKSSTELGDVSADMLLADMSDAVFSTKVGRIVGPVKSELGWHIMKVVRVTPKKETSLAAAKAKIIEALRKEKAYDKAYETIAEIEDKLGAGASLEEIAAEYKAPIQLIKNLSDDGRNTFVPAIHQALVASSDFIDAAFSYNEGEVSQAIEDDNGFALVKVDAVHDSHVKDLKEVRGEIEKMWAMNEKNAIAQEIINDVTHDLENGDTVAEVAKRFGLVKKTTRPLKQSENFANLNKMQMKTLFQEQVGKPLLIKNDEVHYIIVPTKVIKASKNTSSKELDVLRSQAQSDLSKTAIDALLSAYSSNYDVEVNYKYVGITEDN